MQHGLNIIRTDSLTHKQAEDINELYNKCREYEQLSFTITLPDGVSKDELFFLCYENQSLTGFLSMFSADESFIELYGLTRPDKRRKGLFTNLLYRAYSETDFINGRGFLYLSDGKSPDCQAAYNRLGFTLSYSEYIMTKKAPFAHGCDNRISITETDDFSLVRQLYNKIFDSSDEYTDIYISQAQNDSSTKTFLYSMEGKVIGMMQLTDSSAGNKYLWSFGLLPEHRGKKLGHAMLLALFSYADGCCDTISLQVSSGNLPAFRLYHKNGFEITSQVSYYTPACSDII